MTKQIRSPWHALKGVLTVGKIGVFLLALLTTANLGALLDLVLHPEIPYFDEEHLLNGGVYALLVCLLFGGFALYELQRKKQTEVLEELTLALRRSRDELEQRVRERTAELGAALEETKIANQAKTDFLANMSHEMTTPLNGVIGFSQVLQDELYGPLNEKQRECVAEVLNSGQHLHSLISDMLDLARAISGGMVLRCSRFRVTTALHSAIQAISETAQERNLQVSCDLQPEADREIEADAGKLQQILRNLLDNAVKFTPEGGKIQITARLVENGPVNSPSSPGNPANPAALLIAIADTGIGIAPANLPRLFREIIQLESPYTKKYRGTGVGLLLAQKLVELHQGRIWAESAPGQGSTFSFVIPCQINPLPTLAPEP